MQASVLTMYNIVDASVNKKHLFNEIKNFCLIVLQIVTYNL